MNDIDIENRLTNLGRNWPASSVADEVVQHIKSHQVQPARARRNYTLQLTWASSLAAALLLLASLGMVLFGTSQTLQAQVRDAIAKSKAVRIDITTTNDAGATTKAQVWYSPELGFRAESNDKVIVDDRSSQWSWDPRSTSTSNAVVQRVSQDGMQMIAGMLNLEALPEDWKQSRATDHDTEIDGRACQAYLIQQPSQSSNTEGPSQRAYLWRDSQQRVTSIHGQSLNNQNWQTVRKIDIAYDQEIETGKFAYDAPEGSTLVEADRLWEERFPIGHALATTESGGLKFAVHELRRCGPDMFYVVSSVRGTDDYLKKYPPRRRQLNLETTILDIAEQSSTSVQQDSHIATLGTAEVQGVHYMWWIAAQRRYFRIKDGVKVHVDAGNKLESAPGMLTLPILANYRGRSDSPSVVTAQLKLPVGDAIESLESVSKLVRHEIALSPDNAITYVFNGGSLKPTKPTDVTDEALTASIQSQLDWLRSYDELGESNLDLGASKD